MERLARELEAACLRVASAPTAAAEAQARTIRGELLAAAEELGRAGWGPLARILRITAALATETEGAAAQRAARRAHRNGNPVAGLLGDTAPLN